jgi:glycoside/pentoside/hexuronide:cation symporter, GPH family
LSPHSATPSPAAVPLSVTLRYGAGQLGAQIFRDTPAVLLPLFLTTMLAVPAWMSGLVVLVPKLWLIICDPLVGAWSDRLKSRMGRTPFLVGGGIGTAIGFVLLFAITSYPTPLLAALATCVMFFFASTAFSLFSVPYLALASELSPHPHERTRIIILRMIFGTAGVLLGVGASQLLIAHFGGGASGWHGMSYTLGAICLVSMMTTAIGLRHIALIPSAPSARGFSAQFRVVQSNRPFLVLLTTCFVSNVGQASMYTVIGFIFLFVIKAIWLIPAFILVMSVASILSQPFWFWLPRQIGKPRAYVAASLVWALVTCTWFWVRPGDDVLLTMPWGTELATQHVLILVRAVLLGVVNGPFIMLSLSMLTDTIDHQRQMTGAANEGVFSGLFSAFEKLAFAIGPVIAGFVMSSFGFQSSSGAPAPQTDSALLGIILLYSLIPAGLQVLALLVFSRFRLALSGRDLKQAIA